MQELRQDQVIMFDVDNTLVMWSKNFTQPFHNAVKIEDPYDEQPVYLQPNHDNIKLLSHFAGRGYMIVVWSASGWKWAKAVVNALKLENRVDIIMTKPQFHVDDEKRMEMIIGSNIYAGDKWK